jgi:hypothetical protein
MASDWPLLTGVRYSEVGVRTGLTVLQFGFADHHYRKIILLRHVVFTCMIYC